MSYFHTVRISDPRFERDHIRHITVKSPALQGRGDIVVFSPPEAGNDAPLVLLLHGVYGSCWSWAYGGGVHLTAKRMIESGVIRPMHLAMPSDGLWGDGSGYLKHGEKDFEAWIVNDVPQALLETTGIETSCPRFITGLSMGGFGALRIGAKHAHLFNGISAHSAITHFDEMAVFVQENLSLVQSSPTDHSVYETMLRQKDALPPVRFDCGTDDVLLEKNRVLHNQLLEAGITHTYEEFPGDHSWPYWEKNIARSLRFFNDIAST